MKTFVLCLCAFVLVTTLALVVGDAILAADAPQEMVTVIAVTGPCSCTCLVYIEGAEVNRDRCAWRISGDTLHIFVPVKDGK